MDEEGFIPEDQFVPENEQESGHDDDMLARLQEKVNAHNMNYEASIAPTTFPSGVWEGDPGDGTDFIPVVDLPIEDQGAVPTYDMFDQPTVAWSKWPLLLLYEETPALNAEATYDLLNIIKAMVC